MCAALNGGKGYNLQQLKDKGFMVCLWTESEPETENEKGTERRKKRVLKLNFWEYRNFHGFAAAVCFCMNDLIVDRKHGSLFYTIKYILNAKEKRWTKQNLEMGCFLRTFLFILFYFWFYSELVSLTMKKIRSTQVRTPCKTH